MLVQFFVHALNRGKYKGVSKTGVQSYLSLWQNQAIKHLACFF